MSRVTHIDCQNCGQRIELGGLREESTAICPRCYYPNNLPGRYGSTGSGTGDDGSPICELTRDCKVCHEEFVCTDETDSECCPSC